MNDYLVRIFTKEGNIRGLACVTTNLLEEARRGAARGVSLRWPGFDRHL
jgi:hypothetical protein